MLHEFTSYRRHLLPVHDAAKISVVNASLSLYSVVVGNQPKKITTINTRNWQSIPQEIRPVGRKSMASLGTFPDIC